MCHYALCHFSACHYAERHYIVCHNAECYYVAFYMLRVIMPIAVVHNVLAPTPWLKWNLQEVKHVAKLFFERVFPVLCNKTIELIKRGFYCSSWKSCKTFFSTLSPIYTGDYAVHIVAKIDDSVLNKIGKSPIKMRSMRLRFMGLRLRFQAIAFSCDCVFRRFETRVHNNLLFND